MSNTWRQRESVLLAFESAWQREEPPQIDDFVAHVDRSSRALLLSELVMIDFEHRWRQAELTDVDRYFDDYPELVAQHDVRNELLMHEFQLKTHGGKRPTSAELEKRFPDDPSVLNLLDKLGEEPHLPLESRLKPGLMVDEFRIAECVGRGAFAVVYSALDVKLKRDVALKFLCVNDLHSASKTRLKREAQAVATLKHPNIVPVYGAGQYHGHDFVITRLVGGMTLEQMMQQGPIAVRQAVEIVGQICSALHHAHDAGVIHRDIKPANVMVEDDVPMLLDFGLAHLVDHSQDLTLDGDLVGTPAFMPPEQADGRGWQADPRSDIYSLGAMLFSVVFRRLPFEGTTTEIISQILNREPVIPRENQSQIGRDLQTIILKCLEKEPAHRYQSAAALQHDLSAYLDNRPIVARPLSITGRVVKWTRRRPIVAALMVGVFVLAAFAGGAATQLRQVTAQRDRVQVAKNETQFLLARAAADAGRLAMQQGRVESAVVHYQQALERGFEDRVAIQLALVEAYFALRQTDRAAHYLAAATAEPAVDKYVAELTLWRAELALEGFVHLGDGEQLFQLAQHMNLSEASQKYVDGVLAGSSLEAVECFKRATELDPYQYRSRRMLIFMLLSLARLDQADVQIRMARQFYPENVDFILLDALAHAAEGQVDISEALIQSVQMAGPQRDNWLLFCRTLCDLTHSDTFQFNNENETLVELHRLSLLYQERFLPLLNDRRWRFPPRIGHCFAAFTNRLPQLLNEGAEPTAAALQRLVEVHPEASLFLTLGSMRLVGLSAKRQRAEQLEPLQQALKNFQASLDYPGFIKRSGQTSWLAVFTTSLTIGMVHQHDIEINQRVCQEASRHVDVSQVVTFNQTRAFFIAAITAGDLVEADRWMQHWRQIPVTDRRQRIDRIWHDAILAKRHRDWMSVSERCKQVLELDPMHPHAPSTMEAAQVKIQEALRTENQR